MPVSYLHLTDLKSKQELLINTRNVHRFTDLSMAKRSGVIATVERGEVVEPTATIEGTAVWTTCGEKNDVYAVTETMGSIISALADVERTRDSMTLVQMYEVHKGTNVAFVLEDVHSVVGFTNYSELPVIVGGQQYAPGETAKTVKVHCVMGLFRDTLEVESTLYDFKVKLAKAGAQVVKP